MTAVRSILDERVLVLNRYYTAVSIVPARTAFVLLCRKTAEIIAVENGRYVNYDFENWAEIAELQRNFEPDAHSWVRTPRLEIAIPKIVRLLAYDRFPRRQIKLNRRNLYARDGCRCQYCGRRFPSRELTIDHVVPRVQGGVHSWQNLVCACVSCNSRKGGRTPVQAGMRLVRPASEPRHNPVIKLAIGRDRYQTWKTFLNDAYWSVELHE